jgi:hypothetical protein
MAEHYRERAMASRIKDDDIRLAPTDAPVRTDYARDFYSWLMEQARHVREGRWDALDRDNLAEEIESLGREQFNKLESALRVLMLHMLKWDYQPAKRGRSDVLTDNPGLRPRIDEAVTRAYRRARLRAIKETKLEPKIFPDACPYSWDEIVSRDFSL